jgi:hypothetical protein
MIYRVRTINLRAENTSAREVTVRAAAYATEHFPGIQVEILENIAGPRHQIHMVTRCVSLAALETYEAQRKSDSGWQALVEEFRALAAEINSVDYLYRTVA